VATAIVAGIGNGAAFRKGREFAAWLGIVPRQHSTGGKAKLLGISKRGNVYLRKILIHGARAAVLRIKRDRASIGAWLDALDSRVPKNVVVVAMANKLARIAWAVLPAATTIAPSIHNGAEKTPTGLEALTRSHFPAPRRATKFTHRSLHRSRKDERTVTTACLQPGPENGLNDRPTLKDRHARNSSWPGELFSIKRPNTFAQTCLLDQTSPCSPAADHTFRAVSRHRIKGFYFHV
jgi:hypothetical protein